MAKALIQDILKVTLQPSKAALTAAAMEHIATADPAWLMVTVVRSGLCNGHCKLLSTLVAQQHQLCPEQSMIDTL